MNENNVGKPNYPFVALIFLGLGLLIYNLINNKGTNNPKTTEQNLDVKLDEELFQSKPNKEDGKTLDMNDATGKTVVFKSTYNIKLNSDNEPEQKNYEITYNTFDFTNMIVTMRTQMSGEWIKITYPIESIHQKKSIRGFETLIDINNLGVNQILLDTDDKMIIFSYLDGSRIFLKNVTLVR